MKLKDIIKKAGPAAIAAAYPPSAPFIAAINAMLPDSIKLDDTTTGEGMTEAINTMPPELQVQVLELEVSALNTANSSTNENYQSTRAYIAKNCFYIVSACSLIIVSVLAVAVLNNDLGTVTALGDSWPMVLGLILPFTELLRGYFGILRKENADRLNTQAGKAAAVPGIAYLLAQLKK